MNRKVDALIAEHFFGLKVHKDPEYGYMHFAKELVGITQQPFALVKKYSTDIAAAWPVWEKLEVAVVLKLSNEKYCCHDQNQAMDFDYGDWHAIAKTAPLAICLAALKSKNIKVEDD